MLFEINIPGCIGNLSKCKLNDFRAFDKELLWLSDTDYSKFYQNGVIAVPFQFPATEIEYQINHYVMWKTMAAIEATHKPEYFLFLDEDSSEEFHDANVSTICSCWACEFCRQECKKCPIWCKDYSDDNCCPCEDTQNSLYLEWLNAVEDSDTEWISTIKEKIAKIYWESNLNTQKIIIINILKGE